MFYKAAKTRSWVRLRASSLLTLGDSRRFWNYSIIYKHLGKEGGKTILIFISAAFAPSVRILADRVGHIQRNTLHWREPTFFFELAVSYHYVILHLRSASLVKMVLRVRMSVQVV